MSLVFLLINLSVRIFTKNYHNLILKSGVSVNLDIQLQLTLLYLNLLQNGTVSPLIRHCLHYSLDTLCNRFKTYRLMSTKTMHQTVLSDSMFTIDIFIIIITSL